MAGTKISELTELTTPTGEEELVYAKDGQNGKIKVKNLHSGGGGGVATEYLGTTLATSLELDLTGYEFLFVSISDLAGALVKVSDLVLISGNHGLWSIRGGGNVVGCSYTGNSLSSMTFSSEAGHLCKYYGIKKGGGGGGEIPSGGVEGQVLTKTSDSYEWADSSAKYGAEIKYDAIVDAAGNGDYTSIRSALEAGKKRMFVKDGVYNETQGIFVTLAANDDIIIHGQSRNGVVVNTSLTEVPSQWSDFYNYPGLFFVDGANTDNLSISIKNITFNLSINTTQSTANLVRARYKTRSVSGVCIEDCTCNVEQEGTVRAYFNPIGHATNAGNSRGTFDVYNSSFTFHAKNGILGGESPYEFNDSCVYKNCVFVVKASNNNPGRLNIENATDCAVYYDSTGMGDVQFGGDNMDNCYIQLPANISSSKGFRASLSNSNKCSMSGGHNSLPSSHKFSNQIIPEWAPNTAYAAGTQVKYNSNSTWYVCKNAHTSSTSFYDNEDDWEYLCTVNLSNVTNCKFSTRNETVDLGGVIEGNIFRNTGDMGSEGAARIKGNMFGDEDFNIYLDKRNIFTENLVGGYDHAMSGNIYYVGAGSNIITNNIVFTQSIIKAVGGQGTSVVNNNAPWA